MWLNLIFEGSGILQIENKLGKIFDSMVDLVCSETSRVLNTVGIMGLAFGFIITSDERMALWMLYF